MTAAMAAAALTVVTEALDDPDTDIAHSLRLLTLDAAAAVASYRGLSVVVPHSDPCSPSPCWSTGRTPTTFAPR